MAAEWSALSEAAKQ